MKWRIYTDVLSRRGPTESKDLIEATSEAAAIEKARLLYPTMIKLGIPFRVRQVEGENE
jgi:hypothetical protein